MLNWLMPLFTARFLKFASVGASGVVVNLAVLWFCAGLLGINANLSSAVAILVSIGTNFIINEAWTFRDRHKSSRGAMLRFYRFFLVSLGGAIIQWSVFVVMNLCWVAILQDTQVLYDYFGESGGWFSRFVLRPIKTPPDVDLLKYVSQLFGIGAATLWNYFANLNWTWAKKDTDA